MQDPISGMTLRLSVVLLLSLVLAGLRPSLVGAQGTATVKHSDTWLARTTKIQFQLHREPGAQWRLEVPKKDWMVLPTSNSVLLVLAAKKGDAVVIVERTIMRQSLEATDITDLFAQIEIDAIREREPRAAEFQFRILDAGGVRLAAVQYARPGVLGAERVRQYSVPVGTEIYRLTCISRQSAFTAYDPVFSHIAASFRVTE